MDAKIFGAFIAGCRKEMNMTQAELAMKLNVTDKAVSRWERGMGFPDIGTIEPLALTLNISVLEIMQSKKNEPTEFCIVSGYTRPHTVTLTKEGMAQLPDFMRKHAENGGKLWVIKEPKDGRAFIAMSKTGEAVCVNSSYVVCEIRIHPDYIPLLAEWERKHIENGGNLYMIGEPINGKALVSTSAELDGHIEMENHYWFSEYIDTDYSEIAAAMVECINIIRLACGKDADARKRNAGIRLYNYLVYCTTLPDLDVLTSIYRDKLEDNIIGFNPPAVAHFVGKMRSRYPKDS